MTNKYRFLDVEVSAFTLQTLLEEVERGVAAFDRRVLANHNLHSLYLFHRQPELRPFFEDARASHVDGMPLIWIGRLFGFPLDRRNRITYVDLLPPLLALSDRHAWKVFYVGSKRETCVQASAIIGNRYPSIQWAAHDGYFKVEQQGDGNRTVVQAIASFRPDLLLIGMGMPRQEYWIRENLPDLVAGVIMPCGAAVEYIAGTAPIPPRWAGQLGLEWVFRLAAEPRRLSSRYLVEPWYIVLLLVSRLLRRASRL